MTATTDSTYSDAGLSRERPFAERVLRSITKFIRHYPLGAFGAGFAILLVMMAIVPGLFTTIDPTAQVLRDRFQSPSADHWFGTDQLGRDIFARIIYGAQTSIIVGFGVVVVSAALATFLGVVSGYFGGWFDTMFQRFVDIGIALPGLIFIILFITSIPALPFIPIPQEKEEILPIILSVALLLAIRLSRVIRAGAITVREEQYVEAARALGAGHSRIMTRHVVPNVMALVLVAASIEVGAAILIESALAFLGYGIPPPTPSWGRMLNEAREELIRTPHMAIFPGLAIFFTVYSFNMLGDAVRDKLDPRLRGSR
ncbi:MAG: ABC transporter permease [Chloroflexi bacterium]|jgi:peptide/nickel transport system permease protein|nr:ABC transporter permease [Chloroflexota bacterium]